MTRINDRDESRARGAHMVTHGAGQEMPESLHALLEAIRECYALPSGDSSAWADSVLEALGELHGSIMADKMAATLASNTASEFDGMLECMTRSANAAQELAESRFADLRECRADLAAARAERDSLAERNANQERTIRTLDSDVKRLRADLATSDQVATTLASDLSDARIGRDASRAHLGRVCSELGGLTLSMLPSNAYGWNVAKVYAEASAYLALHG